MAPNKPVNQAALRVLRHHRPALTPKQYKTLRGQILAGDDTGALKGLLRLAGGNTTGGINARTNKPI